MLVKVLYANNFMTFKGLGRISPLAATIAGLTRKYQDFDSDEFEKEMNGEELCANVVFSVLKTVCRDYSPMLGESENGLISRSALDTLQKNGIESYENLASFGSALENLSMTDEEYHVTMKFISLLIKIVDIPGNEMGPNQVAICSARSFFNSLAPGHIKADIAFFEALLEKFATKKPDTEYGLTLDGHRTAAAAEPAAEPAASNSAPPVEPVAQPQTVASTTVSEFEERFNLGRSIARGGFAKVSEATDRRTREVYALKQLTQNATPKDKEDFKQECIILASLDHPNIVKFFTSVIDDSSNPICYLMVKAEGSMVDLMKISKLSIIEKMKLLQGVMGGLACIADHGFLHRDIKPDNILYERNGQGALILKVADMGQTRSVDVDTEEYASTALGKFNLRTTPAHAKAIGSFNEETDVYSSALLVNCFLQGNAIAFHFIERAVDVAEAVARGGLHPLGPGTPANVSELLIGMLCGTVKTFAEVVETMPRIIAELEAEREEINVGDGETQHYFALTITNGNGRPNVAHITFNVEPGVAAADVQELLTHTIDIATGGCDMTTSTSRANLSRSELGEKLFRDSMTCTGEIVGFVHFSSAVIKKFSEDMDVIGGTIARKMDGTLRGSIVRKASYFYFRYETISGQKQQKQQWKLPMVASCRAPTPAGEPEFKGKIESIHKIVAKLMAIFRGKEEVAAEMVAIATVGEGVAEEAEGKKSESQPKEDATPAEDSKPKSSSHSIEGGRVDVAAAEQIAMITPTVSQEGEGSIMIKVDNELVSQAPGSPSGLDALVIEDVLNEELDAIKELLLLAEIDTDPAAAPQREYKSEGAYPNYGSDLFNFQMTPEERRLNAEDLLAAVAAPAAPAPAPAPAPASAPGEAPPPASEDLNMVKTLLAGIGLSDVWTLLLAEDVLDIATLVDMSKADFREMGITFGKASMILREAKEKHPDLCP